MSTICKDSLVVVPYRDRPEHLNKFIHSFHKVYASVLSSVDLCIVEQSPEKKFNRGLIKNIGGIHALRQHYKYIYFNDVDILCNKIIMEGAHAQTDWDAAVLYSAHRECFGGVVKLTTDSFHTCNGFPSDLWDWGLEDRSLYYRYLINNMSIRPYIDNTANVELLNHSPSERKWPYKGLMLDRYNAEKANLNCGDTDRQLKYIQHSGVNTADYTILETTVQDNITRIIVQV